MDAEQAVLVWIPLVEADHEVAGERHGVIQKGDGGHLPGAEQGEKRQIAYLKPGPPIGGHPRIDAAAPLLERDDGGVDGRRGGGEGCQVGPAPLPVVVQVGGALLHDRVQEQRGDCGRSQHQPSSR